MSDLTDLPVPNIPLLRKAVEWAEAEAAKTDGPCMWDQGWYLTRTHCGTAYCIAGYTVATQPSYEPIDSLDARVGGLQASYFDHGLSLLGITDEEAVDLFAGNNTIEDVRRAAERIAARAGERL